MKNLFVTSAILPFTIKQARALPRASRTLGYVAVASADHFKVGFSFFNCLCIPVKGILAGGLSSHHRGGKNKDRKNDESTATKGHHEFTHWGFFSCLL